MKQRICWSDTETYSETDLKAHGVDVYSDDPAAEVMLWAYAFDDGPVKVWDRTEDPRIPLDLEDAIDDDRCLFGFHNSYFDRTMIRKTMGIDIPVRRIRDTMVQALAHGLPPALGQLCDALRIPQDLAKTKEGRKLVNLFCKPRPKNQKLRRATRDSHPQEWEKFVDYAGHDITGMRASCAKMPWWNYRDDEFDLWVLDQKINDRGVFVDLDLAQRALEAVAIAQEELAAATFEKTNEEVAAATQRDALLNHILEEYGVLLPDMKKATLERRLTDPDLPDGVKELISIRLQTATTSTSKYKGFINRTSPDGRYRGALQYDGAGRTRRWAGRGVQLHNQPRPDMKEKDIALAIQAIKMGAANLVYPDMMRVASNAIRGCIIASPGKKLVVSDLKNIEGRDAAWLAYDEPMLEAFRQYDAGLAPDVYVQEYAQTFRVPLESVTKKQRQIGKVLVLMLQYQGGVGAFLTGAATYRIDLEELTATVLPVLPDDVVEEADSFYQWWVIDQNKTDYGLGRDTFVVCDALKRLWRRRHPDIVDHWEELQNAAVGAVLHPGKTYTARRMKCRRDGAWLRILLPSGNYLCYPEPLVDDSGSLSYRGLNQYSRRWQRLHTYGGKIFENACQSLARDVMGVNMSWIESAGYNILLTVHDEVITEAPDMAAYSEHELSRLLAANQKWNEGMPLAASGFEDYRYKKED